MKKNHCLLLKTPDNRHFFTHENNFPLLVEFGKTFGAEISVVKADNPPVLELEELTRCLCTPNDNEPPKYEVLEIKLSASEVSNRTKKSEISKQINSYIKDELISGKAVSIVGLLSKFNGTNQTMSGYLTRARRELTAKGYYIKRIGVGEYKVEEMPKKKRGFLDSPGYYSETYYRSDNQ